MCHLGPVRPGLPRLICSSLYASFYSERATTSEAAEIAMRNVGCQPTWVQISALPLTSWVPLGQLLRLPLPQAPRLRKGGSGVYLTGAIVTVEGAHVSKAAGAGRRLCEGPMLGGPWPAKHCLSLQSLLIMQKSSPTPSPWASLPPEQEGGWCRRPLGRGSGRWGPGTGGGSPWLPFRGVCVGCLSTAACCNGKSTRMGRGEVPCAPTPERDTGSLGESPGCCAPCSFCPWARGCCRGCE